MATLRIELAFRAGAQDDHPWRIVAATADGHEHAHPERGRPLRFDDVDVQAVLLRDLVRLLGEDHGAHVVGGTVRQVAGEVGTLPDDLAPFGAGLGRGSIAARQDEDELLELRGRGDVAPVAAAGSALGRGRRLGAVDGLGVVRALGHAAGHELGGERVATVQAIGGRERRQPDRHRTDDPTAEPALGRGRDAHDAFAIEGGRVPDPDDQQAPGGQLACVRQRRRESFSGEFAELGQGRQLAASALVELGKGTLELGRRRHRDDEDVRGHIPRLVGDDTKFHERRILRKREAGPSMFGRAGGGWTKGVSVPAGSARSAGRPVRG